jgi:hypothetical protein
MMMIINLKKQFFWVKIQKNYSCLFSKTITIATVLLITACNNKENYHVESIKTANGWGYTIGNDERIIIKQTVVPVINTNKSFTTEKDALKTAHLVVKKLEANLSPTITKKDLILLDISI